LSEKINIAIIGGGIVGCWLALELSRSEKDIFLFERNPGITTGENQSSRNSGVNHAGINYDPDTRPLKARLCVEGNRMWGDFCEQYSLPFIKVGKLMVALTEEEDRELDLYERRAFQNNVPDVRKITVAEVRKIEPNVDARSALFIPSSGVFEPTSLLRQVYFLASNQGVQFMTGTEVVAIDAKQGKLSIRIRYRDGSEEWVETQKIINAGGVKAVSLAKMVDNDFPLKTAFIRGDSMKFNRKARHDLHLKGINIYPTPRTVKTPFGFQSTVGVHLTPMFDIIDGQYVIGDTVMVGPRLTVVNSDDDFQTPMPEPESFVRDTGFFPGLNADDLTPNFGGIQARLDGYPDFYISRDRLSANIVHLVGIDSPGFTSAPAIARHVVRKFFKSPS
jgi:L-2-hydroxyglutarate oxidase LhgO